MPAKMTQFYVEGLYVNKQGAKKKRKTGVYPPSDIEPYAKAIWADSPMEAIQIATDELEGGEWTVEPTVSQVTEEQRMRAMDEPEFPGLSAKAPKKPKRK